MSDHIESIRAQLWKKMRGSKKYRDTFVAAHLSTNIAAQIQTLRETQPEPWTKKELAERAGMSPSRITVMEDPSYEKFTLSTLKRIASAFDVALVVRFVAFSELVNWVSDLSPEKMTVPSFCRDSITPSIEQAAQKTTGENANQSLHVPDFSGTGREKAQTARLGESEQHITSEGFGLYAQSRSRSRQSIAEAIV